MMNIAILAGGYTSEREISLSSGHEVQGFIDASKYSTFLVEVDPDGLYVVRSGARLRVDLNDFSFMELGQKTRFDYAFIALHGSPGEDGRIQAYLDMLHVPYSSCGVYASMATFNKSACKKLLSGSMVRMAVSVRVAKGEPISVDDIVSKVGLPCFVKPDTAGSSFGVSKVYDKGLLLTALAKAFTEDNTALVEQFVKGTEVSCGIYRVDGKKVIIGITEIDTKNDFFDTEAKYTPGFTNEITPARISDSEAAKVEAATSFIYDELGCRGIVRVDFIIQNGEPFFIEVNSIPGMSGGSIIPKQIRHKGWSFADVMDNVIAETNSNIKK